MQSRKSYLAKKKASVSTVKKIVKQTLARNIETKVVQTAGTLQPRVLNSGSVVFNDNNLTLTPWTTGFVNTQGYQIGNGVGQDQRIGDEVRLKGVYLNYQITPNAQNATTNASPKPMVIRIYFIRPKINETGGPTLQNYVSGSANAIFFENQANADSGFTGNLIDLNRKIDRDNYTVIGIRTHKLGYSSFAGASVPAERSGFNNNDFQFMCMGRFKLKSPKMFKFDRNDAPKMQPIYAIIQVMPADNTGSLFTDVTRPVTFSYNIACYFTDP